MIKDYGIALAKLLFAGAWVDGELSRDEVQSVESFLDTVPGLTEDDLKRVYLYSEFPMTAEESRLVAEQFVAIIRTEEEKEMALLHLESLVKADRIVTPEERCFYIEMLNFLENAAVSSLERFSKLLRKRNKWKPSELPLGQDRESLWLDHYVNNPVYFRLRVAYMGFDLPDDLSERQFEQACLLVSLMVLIEKEEGSFRADLIADYLERHFEITPEVAAYLVDLAASDHVNGRLNTRKQALHLVKVTDFSQVDAFFFGMVSLLRKAKTQERGKRLVIYEIARILKIDETLLDEQFKV